MSQDGWFGMGSMLNGVLGEESDKSSKGSIGEKSPRSFKKGSPRAVSWTSLSSSMSPRSKKKSDLDRKELLKSRTPRQSYLQIHDEVKNWHNDLKDHSSQIVAKMQIIEAISAIRGTLQPIKTIGPYFGTAFKWSAGSIAPDGRIYFAPHGAEHVLCLNPVEGSITKFGDPINLSSHQLLLKVEAVSNLLGSDRKFSASVVGPTGESLYLIPASARYVVKMNLSLGTWMRLEADLGGMDWKWGNGVLIGDKIFASPHNSNKVLMIDTKTDEASLIGPELGSQSSKFGPPVVVPYDKTCKTSRTELVEKDAVIIFPPLGARRILALDPLTHRVSLIGEEFSKSHFKYDGACLGADGAVYCAPSCASQFLRIEVDSIEDEDFAEEDSDGSGWDDTAASNKKSSGRTASPNWRSGFPRKKSKEPSPPRGNSSRKTKAKPTRLSAKTRGTKNEPPSPDGSPRLSVDVPTISTSSDQADRELLAFSAVRQWPPKVTVQFMGAERTGSFKFGSMVLSADGRTAIAVPMNGTSFISIDTTPGLDMKHRHVLRMGVKLPSRTLRFGGSVIGLDGYLYCAPLHAGHVMRLDTLALAPPKIDQSEVRDQTSNPMVPESPMSFRERALSPQNNAQSQQQTFPVVSWPNTSDTLFNVSLFKQQSEKSEKNEASEVNSSALSASKTMLVIAAGVHWRKWAAARARESRGVSASDRVVGNSDRQMKSLLLQEPEVWCYGLTLEDSSIPSDLCDWLYYYSETEDGIDFIESCGSDASDDMVHRVASVPNLVFSIISLEKHALFMRLPIIRKAIVKPVSFCGDWLVKCFTDKRLMETSVEFFELVSKDLHRQEVKDQDGVVSRNKTFEQIAFIDHLVSPMLRLPHRLQDRIASTELMAGILDELFTERPLAMLVIWFDFCIIVILLSLLIRATWQVQHEGPLKVDEYLVIAAIVFFNLVFLGREFINMRALHRLGLTIGFTKTLDVLTTSSLFVIVFMSFFEDLRLRPIFLIVASLTSGLCWMKLLGFLSGLHLQFAVYLDALKLITKALRIYLVMFFIILAMFANMYYVLMKQSRYNGEDDVTDLFDATFTTPETAFLTLFRMLLGDFEMDWFRREEEHLMTTFAVSLFILYMIFVFIIMMNVLIAVVCDNYSFAMSKAHEIFLRSRLQLVANLDMQGFTTLRNQKKLSRDSVILMEEREFARSKSKMASHASSSFTENMAEEKATKEQEQGSSFHEFTESLANFFDRILKETLWHRTMREFLGIQMQTRIFKQTIAQTSSIKAEASVEEIQEKTTHKAQEMKTAEVITYFEERMRVMREEHAQSEQRIIFAMEQRMAAQMEALKVAISNK